MTQHFDDNGVCTHGYSQCNLADAIIGHFDCRYCGEENVELDEFARRNIIEDWERKS